MIRLCSYSAEAVDCLEELEKVCFGVEAWSRNALESELKNSFSRFFVYVENGETVGYVCFRLMADEAEICSVCVHPDYRRRSIASKLLCAAAEYALLKGIRRAELEVNTDNKEAVALYLKHGYVIESLRKNFYGKTRFQSRDAYLMILRF